jgi:hypothetical protein
METGLAVGAARQSRARGLVWLGGDRWDNARRVVSVQSITTQKKPAKSVKMLFPRNPQTRSCLSKAGKL